MKHISDVTKLLDSFFEFFFDKESGILDHRRFIIRYRPYNSYKKLPLRKVSKAMYELKRQGYCVIEQIEGKPYIVFSKKAQHRFLMMAIVNSKIKLRDQERCFVSFDIPLEYNKVRNGLRRLLKDAGFKKMHQSFWVTDKDIACYLIRWVLMHDANKYIKIIVGRNLKK